MLLLLVTTGCGALGGPEFEPRNESVTVPADARVEHLVIISIDGLRADAILEYDAPTLQRLAREGAHSFEAITIHPSRSLPAHTSMLTGLAPSEHAVLWNEKELDAFGYIETPTIFARATAHGLHAAAFFSKSKFHHLLAPGSLTYGQSARGFLGKRTAPQTVGDVERYLAVRRPNLLFVHLGEPDFVGHALGWMSWPYGWAVRQADAQVARLLAACDRAFGAGGYTVLFTADHGGHARDHGSADARDMLIPWIAWGRGVRPGVELEPGIRTMDTAATALWLLGLPDDPASDGRVVRAAFETADLQLPERMNP